MVHWYCVQWASKAIKLQYATLYRGEGEASRLENVWGNGDIVAPCSATFTPLSTDSREE
jgi:hypothetical protein